jgi:pimeloyl-ACP methyl ester carboxylesterase
LMWIDPGYTQVLRRLGGFARTVIFDARGLGLSDPLDHVPTVEESADDLGAVMDAARIERAVLLAMGTGYPAVAMFAARAPKRVEGLVVVAPCAVGIAASSEHSRPMRHCAPAATTRSLSDGRAPCGGCSGASRCLILLRRTGGARR